MNAMTYWDKQVQETDAIGGERRRDKRYELRLDVRWNLIRRRRVLDTGYGTTLDFSSGGILLETDRPLPNGLNLELFITWPVMLHNVTPLQLVVNGRIARVDGNRVAVRMVEHEFRTLAMPVEHRDKPAAQAAIPRPSCSVQPGLPVWASRRSW